MSFDDRVNLDSPLHKDPEYLRRADEIQKHLQAAEALMKELGEFHSCRPDIITGKPMFEWVIHKDCRPYFTRVRD